MFPPMLFLPAEQVRADKDVTRRDVLARDRTRRSQLMEWNLPVLSRTSKLQSCTRPSVSRSLAKQSISHRLVVIEQSHVHSTAGRHETGKPIGLSVEPEKLAKQGVLLTRRMKLGNFPHVASGSVREWIKTEPYHAWFGIAVLCSLDCSKGDLRQGHRRNRRDLQTALRWFAVVRSWKPLSRVEDGLRQGCYVF